MSCEICGEDLNGLQYGVIGIDIETKGDLVQWMICDIDLCHRPYLVSELVE